MVVDRKKAGHKRFAKLFQTLLIRMLRCETVVEYNALRHELTEAIIREPLVLIWHRRKAKTKLNYTMTPRLALALEGKEEPVLGNISPIHQHQYGGQVSGNKPMEFNPNDFHMMSIEEPSSIQQGRNSRDGYVAISGFQEQPERSVSRNSNQGKGMMTEQISCSPNKGKKMKMKTESEKSFQSKQTFNAAASSQGTLDEIEEERENEEQQSQLKTSESTLLNGQRKGKKKKGATQSKVSTPIQDLPPPPPMTEGDDDDYYDSGSQQVHISSRMGPSSSRNVRGMSARSDHRSIVYDEEEENMLSDDSDNMDDDMTYTRN